LQEDFLLVRFFLHRYAEFLKDAGMKVDPEDLNEDISRLLPSAGLRPNLGYQAQGQIQANVEAPMAPTATAGSFSTPSRRKVPVSDRVTRPIPFNVDTSPLALRSSRYRAIGRDDLGSDDEDDHVSEEDQEEDQEGGHDDDGIDG
jgi:hypothetical protein